MNTEQTVKTVIAELCGSGEVNDEDLLKEDLGLDSLSIVELIAEIEDALKIRFEMAALNPDELLTVKDLIDLADKTI